MMFGLFRMWLSGLLSIAIWVGVVYLAREWYRELPHPQRLYEPVPGDVQPPPPPQPPPTFGERLSAWKPGFDKTTALLAGAVALTLLSLGGGRALMWLFLPKGKDDPKHERPGEHRTITRPDGTELHVEITGNARGPTVVLTHGWGATATEWYCLRRQLAAKYRIVAWDLPGLGLSTSPRNKDFSLGKLAADLQAVVHECAGGPAVLVGHSIGGMTSLTFAKDFPEELGNSVVGLVLVHTTPTNPLKTMPMAGLYTALQKPVIEPLCHASKVMSPFLYLMNVQGYLNGSQHFSNYKSAFSFSGTWGQLEFATRYLFQVWPATYARGGLGMFRTYDTSDALGRITVPTLVVAGDRDKVTKPEASDWIHRDVPGAAKATLAPGGHLGLLSRHEEFGAAVEGFLQRCFAAEPALAGAR